MDYPKFLEKLRDFNYVTQNTLSNISRNSRTLRNQLVQWCRQGKVVALKRGIYTLNDQERRVPLPPFLTSNLLSVPSYVSFESALEEYGLIPERVAAILAVSARRTAVFKNHYGTFRYHFLKKERFFGYQSLQKEGIPVLVAFPEKAILDKIYFDRLFRAEPGYFLDHLRLQNFEGLSTRRLVGYARRFGSRKVLDGALILKDLIAAERR